MTAVAPAPWGDRPWTIGNGAVGVRGAPSSRRTFPELCASYHHPGETYNPSADLTWCLCGARIYYGQHLPLGVRSPLTKVVCEVCREPTLESEPSPHVAPRCPRCERMAAAA